MELSGKQLRFRIYLVMMILLAGFCLLFYRLYRIQIVEHDYYASRVPGSRIETIRLPGIRGEIRDRNGAVLADSTPNYELRLNLREIVADYRKRKGAVPTRLWTRYDSFGQPVEQKEIDVVTIVEETVFPQLGELGLLADYSARALQRHYRSNRGLVPFTYRRDLSFREFASFAEHNLGVPGVSIARTGRRRYLYDSLAAHTLGYLNLANPSAVPEERKKDFSYYVGDDFGVMGVEKTLDHHLQGQAGKLIVEKDARRRFVGVVAQEDPMPGAAVELTLDLALQFHTEQALREIGRGAAVAIDPQTGGILAIASVPSFNPNVFVPEISQTDWDRYTEDSTSPMFNRAVNSYAPGSTFKIPIALAGGLTPHFDRKFPCAGGAQYGKKFMKCWCHSKGFTHGTIDVSQAIKVSCNGFFYRYANETGIRNIETMSEVLGLGRRTQVPLSGEAPGSVPNPDWLRLQGLNWSDAFTALVSIGQGATEATPLQMASVTATVANGGKVFDPQLIQRVVAHDGTVIDELDPNPRTTLTQEGLTAEQVETVKRGMWRVVNEGGGTARKAAISGVEVSGKTGTSQTGNPRQPTNAWFVSFAPYDDPQIAVAVFVENGKSGGSAASPIARQMIRSYLQPENFADITVNRLPEAVGHFDQIASVSFGGEGTVAVAASSVSSNSVASSTPNTSVDVSEFEPPEIRKRRINPLAKFLALPTLKPKNDSRGAVGATNKRPKPKFRPFRKVGKRR